MVAPICLFLNFLWILCKITNVTQFYTDPVSKIEDYDGFFENRPPLLSKIFFGRMDVPTNILWSHRFGGQKLDFKRKKRGFSLFCDTKQS